MRYKRKRGPSFCKMFCIVSAMIVSSVFLLPSESFAKICVGSVLPCMDFNSTVRSTIEKANASLNANDKNNLEKTVSASSNQAYVPDDIKKLIEQAEKQSPNDKKDGAIVEHLYDKSSATDSTGNILVRNASDKSINFDSVLDKSPDLHIDSSSNEPSILIFHTHTTESYQMLDRDFYAVGFTSRSEDNSKNMVRVGDEIVAMLQSAGFKVIHDTAIYDKTYNGAYDRSGAAIDGYLKKHPSIQVILDIHRDAIQDQSGTKTKPVALINGKKAAQLMIISGCEGDGVTGFPDWEYNLRFALKLQQKCTDNYPQLMRPLLFDNRRYNMYKSHCSLLIEVGSDSNTLDEACYSARLLGSSLAELLKDYISE